VAGVTAADGVEGCPVRTPLVAVTVKVQLSPLVSPLTVTGFAVPVAVWPPSAGVVRSTAVTE